MATNTAINRSCDNFRLSQTALVVAGYPLAEDPKTRGPEDPTPDPVCSVGDSVGDSFAGFLGPGELEPHKQAAWWWAAEQGCTFSMRVVASDSWTPASLKQAETRALSQANFAWNSSRNSGYRMGADFWGSIGLQPAEVKVKQMLTTMFKQPDGGNQKRILSTVGLPFDLP